MTPIRLCILGHSGAGKSTTAAIIGGVAAAHSIRCEVVKVAAPLYELQHAIYSRLGHQLDPGQQDQVLLEQLATWIRARDPRFLVGDFLSRAEKTPADLLVNDDVRSFDFDYPELRRRGWVSIRVSATQEHRRKRLAALGYVSLSDSSTAGVDETDVDFDVRNDASVDDLREEITTIVEAVLAC
ncbi:hypothetical protein [Nocardia brasiliensis]|uniref:hypothetical protein n=1 Tax=Nocardia brasiliensis TaxID=37326 RepID=UPI00245644FF|nr:hypothetical protein [Nocardia brasiliensis]